MSTDVRVEIQHHETVLRALENEVTLIVLRVARDEAKDAGIVLRVYA
jgi:hypothetical protein